MTIRKHATEDRKPLVAVDLFAGGGGLTLGLKQAGFLVSAAVEIDRDATNTYVANHSGTVMFRRDIRLISGTELIRTSPTNSIDLIAACPPCQGFSQLTSKYRRSDPRNELIHEFVRLVSEIRPTTLMMENVPGLAIKGAELFNSAMDKLRSFGYQLSSEALDVANYGVPQRRRRLVVLGALGFPIAIPQATHARVADQRLKRWVTVRETIGKMNKPIILPSSQGTKATTHLHWHVIRNMSQLNLQRLRATSAGTQRAELPLSLRPKCHQGTDSGFSNVYGRMSWDAPAPTITGGCTTLSKGRFGHPSLLRTISVREAALLQSFPKNYIFDTSYIDHVCNIIGNALPPRFARVMASACRKAIETQHDSQ